MRQILALISVFALSNTVLGQTQMNWFEDINICETHGDTTIAFPSSAFSDSTFTWMFENSVISHNANNSLTLTESGVYSLFVYNTNSDTLTDSFTLTIDTEFNEFMLTMTDSELNVDSVVNICLEDNPTLITPHDGYTHYWYLEGVTLGDTLTERTLVLQDIKDVVEFGQEQIYSVEVENACGIYPAKNTVTIEVNECHCALNMPNIFTPNGDDQNDVFRPLNDHELQTESENICESTDFTMEIYSQWGRHMTTIKSGDEYPSWDGLSKGGNDVPAGIYYYQIDYKVNVLTLPKQKQITGFFHLFR